MIQRFSLPCGLLLLFFSLEVASANPGRWEFIGPGMLPVQHIVGDRNHPKIWYVAITSDHVNNAGLLFRSSDGAESWKPIFHASVGNVFLRPRNSDLFVIAREGTLFDENGLWKSTDHSKSFIRIADFPFMSSSEIRFDPVNNRTLYAIDDNSRKLMISYDEGKNWESKSALPTAQTDCTFTDWFFNDLLISPFNRNVLYGTAITSCTRNKQKVFEFLLESKDQGLHWSVVEQLPRGESHNFDTRFHMDSAFPDHAFLYGDNGLRILTHAGWTLISSSEFTGLASVSGEPQHLYATYFGRLSESLDGGLSWQKVQRDLNGNISAMQTRKDGTLIAGNQMGIYHYDSFNHWHPKNFGFNRQRGRSFELDLSASRDSTLFAFLRNGWNLYSKNANQKGMRNLSGTYQLSGTLRGGSVGVSPSNSHNVVLFDGNQAFFSLNSGKSWSESSLPIGTVPYQNSFSSPVFDPQDESVVYLMIDNTVLKSVDAGAVFVRLPISGQFPFYHLVIDESHSNILFFTAQYGGGIYKSVDGGQTLQRADFGLPRSRIATLAALPGQNDYIAASFHGTIYRSRNGGDSWTKVAKIETDHPPDPESCRYQGACLIESLYAETSKHWFVITRSSGDLYESTDAGLSWTRVNDQFQGPFRINEITDPRNKPFYVATNVGVFESR